MRFKSIACAIAGLACLAPMLANAEVTYQEEHQKRLRTSQTVQPVGPTPFGESINLYTGEVGFSQTDITLEGIGPTISITRDFKKSEWQGESTPHGQSGFGDWQLAIPHIMTLTPGTTLNNSVVGQWKVETGVNQPSLARCTNFSSMWSPPYQYYGPKSGGFEASEWWRGYQLVLSGSDTQELLVRAAGNNRQPSTGAYRVVTTGHWQIGCLSNTSNNHPGEAFVALSPDGTKYWFDHLVYSPYETVVSYDEFDPRVFERQSRNLARMYVSRIEDRFGNWVTYHYNSSSDRLDAITASDGRSATIEWWADAPVIKSITTQAGSLYPRTWQYHYVNRLAGDLRLSQVMLPDNSWWSFDMGAAGASYPPLSMTGCLPSGYVNNAPPSGQATGATIRAPSGLTGMFLFAWRVHAQSYTQSDCVTPMNQDAYEHENPYSANLALIYKQFTGPGAVGASWSYNYEAPYASAERHCPNWSCQSTRFVEVTDTAGSVTRYTHSTRYDAIEGKLLRIDYGLSGGVALKSEVFEYEVAPGARPYPSAIGYSMQTAANSYKMENIVPVRVKTIHQQGMVFTWRANSFDPYMNPISVTRSSTLGYGRTDVTAYHHNTDKWVIGQVASSTNTNSGLVESQTNYWASSALPMRTWSFGKAQQYVEYNADGTPQKVVDGNNHATLFFDWKRGIPQRIRFPPTPESPGGATQLLSVDDQGSVRSVTDENGYATGYGYDAMGRLSAIAYPADDSVTWTATTRVFTMSSTAKYGLPPGHWQQSVSTGNARNITYYDAMWRPVVAESFDAANENNTRTVRVTRYNGQGNPIYQSYPQRSIESDPFGLYPALVAPPPRCYWTLPRSHPDTEYVCDPVTSGPMPWPGAYSSYDGLNRISNVWQNSELGLLQSTTEYLPLFRTRVTNPRGKSTTTDYMAWDQPSTELPVAISHPENALTRIHRNVLGNPLYLRRYGAQLGMPESTRWFVYDDHQRLCKRIEPETGATVMAYDEVGNLSWSASGQALSSTTSCDYASVPAAAQVHRTYDARNRLKTLRFPDTRGDQDWEYTADGLPWKVSTRNVTTPGASHPTNLYAYNKRRMLTTETLALPAWYTWSIGYAYDANGSLASQTYPSGQTVSYAPNALGQATQAIGTNTYASGVSYHPNGAIAGFTYGNGIVHTMTPNVRQLPGRSTDSGGVLDHEYSYDPTGNVTYIGDHVQGSSHSRWMQYDGLDRLTNAGSAAFGGDHWHRFTYDALDNLTSWKLAGVKDYANYYYEPATQRLTNIQNTAGASVVGLGYDVRGNVTNKSGLLFDFDVGNRLRETTQAGVVLERYRYDVAGRRILANRMSGPAGSTGVVLSQYAQNGQLLYQSSDRTATTTDHIYLGGSLIAQREAPYGLGIPSIKYQHTDALGSPVAVTNSAAQVLERMQYEPYGKVINGAPKDGPGYTGHVLDAATGLNYMQQRYYDPDIGRFPSVDPVTAYDSGDMRFFNRYAYAFNSPYKFTDPDGRCPACDNFGDSYAAMSGAEREGLRVTLVEGIKTVGRVFLELNSGGPGGGGKLAAVGAVTKGSQAASAFTRAKEIQGALSPRTQRAVTTAVAETKEGVRVVGTSEGKLRPAQQAALQAGEIAPAGAKGVHAEINAVNGAKGAGLTPTSVSPSRPACSGCQEAMKKLDIPIKDR